MEENRAVILQENYEEQDRTYWLVTLTVAVRLCLYV